jgi:hypothetical protein
LPLVAGTVWEYTYVKDEDTGRKTGMNLPPPERFIIEVLSVSPKEIDGKPVRGAEVVKLKESYRAVAKETEITCDATGMFVSPESFFYTGEVGGGLGVTLSEVRRGLEEYTWPAKREMTPGTTWREDVVATSTRTPAPDSKLDPSALPPAIVEMEREAKVGETETLTTANAEYKKALKVTVGLRGRAKGDAKKAAVNMPDSRAEMWFAPDIGLVKVTNRYAKTFELSDHRTPDAGK